MRKSDEQNLMMDGIMGEGHRRKVRMASRFQVWQMEKMVISLSAIET